jgi:hypothetical protein
MYIEISRISDLDLLENVLKRADRFCNQEGFDLIIKEQFFSTLAGNKGREQVSIDDTISKLRSQLYRNTQSEHMRLHPDTSVNLYIKRK